MKPFKHTITIYNKKYDYTITPVDKNTIFFECPAAKISQEFLAEDVPELLAELPETIVSFLDYKKGRKEVIRFKVSTEDKKEIQKKAAKAGYDTISAFLRDLALGNN